jgi:integrase
MSSSEITGSVVSRAGKRGTVLYAKVRVEGKQKWIRLGKLWAKQGAPAAGYLTMRQATARLVAIQQGDDPLVNFQPTGAMFPEAVDAWLSDRGRECDESTMHDYRSTSRKWPAYFSGPIESITTADIEAFRDALLDEGLSARTVNKHLTLLYGVFKLARVPNPVEHATKPRQGKPKLGQYLRAPEVLALAERAPTTQESALYCVAAFTGLRWGELRALRWGDVRFSDSLVQVNRNWPVHGSEKDPKSHKPRSVPLWDQAAMPLAQLATRKHFTSDDDYVFVQETGEPLGYDWTIRRFKAARDAAGLTSPRAGMRR